MRSVPGAGATFWFTAVFRRANPAGQMPAVADSAAAVKLEGVRALLVESSAVSRGILTAQANGWRMVTRVTDTLEQALPLLKQAAARGVPFDEMAVFLRSPSNYLGLLEHACHRGGIPAYFDRGVRRPDPAGRAFVALLSSMACAIPGIMATRTLPSAKDRVATMMGARMWTQQYAWNAHYGKAIKAGIKPSTLDAIAEGRRPTEMAKDEEVLYDFVTEVLANKSVSDPTYEKTVAQFGESGVIDILGIVGYYSMLGMIMNVARTAFTDGRPLPLIPTPVQLRSLMPGTVSPTDYTMHPSQAKEF